MTLTDCKCPNCGASVSTDICEYCGTKFPKRTGFDRDWVEEKGHITPEALKYAENTYETYNELGENGLGAKLWNDIKALPVKTHDETPTSNVLKAMHRDLCRLARM